MYKIEISDSPITGLKRKVSWEGGFYFSKRNQQIKLFTICEMYKNENGNYGDLISILEVKPFERIFTSTDAILINPINGKQCYSVEENGSLIWRQKNDNSLVANPVGQYSYLENMIFSGSVDIPAIIESVIQDEDQVNHAFDK